MIDPEYFERKRAQLGMDRGDVLNDIQKFFDKIYPGQIRAKSLNKGVLKLITPNASIANNIRMDQVELLKILNKLTKDYGLTRIQINIG